MRGGPQTIQLFEPFCSGNDKARSAAKSGPRRSQVHRENEPSRLPRQQSRLPWQPTSLLRACGEYGKLD